MLKIIFLVLIPIVTLAIYFFVIPRRDSENKINPTRKSKTTKGITHYNKKLAMAGYNSFRCSFFDMSGKIVKNFTGDRCALIHDFKYMYSRISKNLVLMVHLSRRISNCGSHFCCLVSA